MTEIYLIRDEKRCRSKFAWITGAIVSIIIFITATVMLDSRPRSHSTPTEFSDIETFIDADTCQTWRCRLTARNLLESMDQNVKPCEDFYSFACGDYRANLRMDKVSSINVFDEVRDSHIVKLISLFKETSSYVETDAGRKVLLFYSSCVHPQSETSVYRKAKNVLNSFGKWPLARGKNWKMPSGNRTQVLARLLANAVRQGFVSTLLTFEIIGDLKEPLVKRVCLGNSGMLSDLTDLHPLMLGLRKSRFARVKEVKSRTFNDTIATLMIDFAVIFGNFDSKMIDRDVKDLLEFIADLPKTKPLNREKLSVSYNKLSIGEMIKFSNQNSTDWLKFFNIVFGDVSRIDQNEKILVTDVEYFRQLPAVLQRHSTRTIYNFVLMKMTPDVIKVLKPLISDDQTERELLCIKEAQNAFPYALTRLYVDRPADEKKIIMAKEMLDAIQKAMNEAISGSVWLDTDTKKQALDKQREMKNGVGFPEWIFNDTHLNHLYENITIKTDHIRNMLEVSKFKMLDAIKNIRKPVDRNEIWTDTDPLIVNAFNNLLENKIVIPLGILQSPFFEVENLAAVNFGSLGSIIGHELSHSFDTKGQELDAKSVLRDWWSEESLKVYEKKTKCFVDQYNEYCPLEFRKESGEPGCLNGSLIIGETASDNLGLKIAYEAYQKWVSKNGKENKLIDLEGYSMNQLFFISFAHNWCERYDPSILKSKYGESVHPPGRYRVQGSVSNLPEFAEAFNCPVGPMNRGQNSCKLF